MTIKIEKLKDGNYMVITDTVLPNNTYMRCKCRVEGDILKACDNSDFNNDFTQGIFNITLGKYYHIVDKMKTGDVVTF